MFFPRIRGKIVGVVFLWWWSAAAAAAAAPSAPCDKSRRVFTEPSGVITDGPSNSNYTQVSLLPHQPTLIPKRYLSNK